MNAARELRRHNVNVVLLEARNRVGGRTMTKSGENKSKFWVDLGGSYVGPTQNNVLNLIEELKLETYLVEDTLNIAYMRTVPKNGERRQYDKQTDRWKVDICSSFSPESGDPPFGNLFNWLDYVNMIRRIDSYGAQIPSEAPWMAPHAAEWDSMTFKQFIDSHAWTQRVRDYFNQVFATIDVCVDANEMSMLWFLWYVKQCGGYGRIISTTNGGQERKVKNGTQQLSNRLAELVGSERVKFNKVVYGVDQTDDSVVVWCTDNTCYRAKYVISAMPIHLLLKIHWNPCLPQGKNLLAQRSPMGQVAKVILYYETQFWKKHNLSGCFLFDSCSRRSQPIILSLDDTKPDGSHPAVIGFNAARAWFELRNKSDEEVAKIVAQSYVDATGIKEFMNYVHVERFDWTTEQYSGGGYTSTHAPGTLSKFGKYLREPHGRVHFAGTETAIKWSGYMDGALSAGKRAAREILFELRILKNNALIWEEDPDNKLVPPKPFEYPPSHYYAPRMDTLVKLTKTACILGLGVSLAVIYRPRILTACSSLKW